MDAVEWMVTDPFFCPSVGIPGQEASPLEGDTTHWKEATVLEHGTKHMSVQRRRGRGSEDGGGGGVVRTVSRRPADSFDWGLGQTDGGPNPF